MQEQLNRKLLEIAGFKQTEYQVNGAPVAHPVLYAPWDDPNGGREGCPFGVPPDFTSSVDAIFKWLVPPIVNKGCLVGVSVTASVSEATIVLLDNSIIRVRMAREEVALALCKAFEQLEEQGKRIEIENEPVWKTPEGQKIPVSQLTDFQLLNIRDILDGFALPAIMSYLDEQENTIASFFKLEYWQNIIDAEVERRGI